MNDAIGYGALTLSIGWVGVIYAVVAIVRWVDKFGWPDTRWVLWLVPYPVRVLVSTEDELPDAVQLDVPMVLGHVILVTVTWCPLPLMPISKVLDYRVCSLVLVRIEWPGDLPFPWAQHPMVGLVDVAIVPLVIGACLGVPGVLGKVNGPHLVVIGL